MSTKQPGGFFVLSRAILLCMLLLPGYLFAQRVGTVKQIVSDKWQLDATVNGVQFFHKITECGGRTVVFLKFDNTNAGPVKISWNESFLVAEGRSTSREPSTGKKQLDLLPGKLEQANCDDPSQKVLIARPIQKTPVYSAQIVGFSFSDIIVKE